MAKTYVKSAQGPCYARIQLRLPHGILVDIVGAAHAQIPQSYMDHGRVSWGSYGHTDVLFNKVGILEKWK